jgi:CO dehydrogenase nickel-insertion accessory protein CooC1
MNPFASTVRHLCFTGKGGVGKTALACAAAISLADGGRRVLRVSTDPASNLDEMLATKLSNAPTPIPGVPRLAAMNLDPERAAEAYRGDGEIQVPRDLCDALPAAGNQVDSLALELVVEPSSLPLRHGRSRRHCRLCSAVHQLGARSELVPSG